MVGAQEIVALVERDRVAIGLPRIGKNVRGAVLIEPADLGIAQQENSAQHEFADALGIGLRIGERQGAAPRSAEYQPALDAEMLAQSLDVGDQMPGRVLDEAGARPAASAAALIEHHDAVVLRVEELPRALVGAGAGPAVQEYGRLAGRIAASPRSRSHARPRRADSRAERARSPDTARGARRCADAGREDAFAYLGGARHADFAALADGFLLGRRVLGRCDCRAVARDLAAAPFFFFMHFSSCLETYARETKGPSGFPPSRCTCR